MGYKLKDDLEKVDKYYSSILQQDLGIETEAAKRYIRLTLANACLFDRKQRDYGPRNISGFGTFGVVVRMNDKFERLKTLFTKKRRAAVDESIEDTLRDICNYAIIALLVERGEWPSA